MPHGLPPQSELSTEILRGTDGVRLVLRGELDMNGVLAVERAVLDASAVAADRIVIDLAELRFMDLFGARALLRAASAAHSDARPVVIANPRRHVRRLFELITDIGRGRVPEIELVQNG